MVIYRDPPVESRKEKSYAGKRYCCVPGCFNYETKILKDGRRVTLHRIPTASRWPKCREEFVTRLRNIGYLVEEGKETRICGEHFEGEYVHGSSVPTVWPHKPHTPKKRVSAFQDSSATSTKSVAMLPHKEYNHTSRVLDVTGTSVPMITPTKPECQTSRHTPSESVSQPEPKHQHHNNSCSTSECVSQPELVAPGRCEF